MKQRGFTLVEMIVALTLALLALAGVYGTFRAVHESIRRVEGLNEQLQSARTAMRVIRRDVEAIHPLRLGSLEETPMMVSTGEVVPEISFYAEDFQDPTANTDLDTLRFTTATNDPRFHLFPTGGVVEVYYYVDIDPSTPEEGLVRQINYWPNLLPQEIPIDESELPREVIAPEVRGMNLRFLDDRSSPESGGEWVDTWEYPDRLPAALEITLFFARQTNPETGEVTEWNTWPEVIPLIRRTVITPPTLSEEEEQGPGEGMGAVGAEPPGQQPAPQTMGGGPSAAPMGPSSFGMGGGR